MEKTLVEIFGDEKLSLIYNLKYMLGHCRIPVISMEADENEYIHVKMLNGYEFEYSIVGDSCLGIWSDTVRAFKREGYIEDYLF